MKKLVDIPGGNGVGIFMPNLAVPFYVLKTGINPKMMIYTK